MVYLSFIEWVNDLIDRLAKGPVHINTEPTVDGSRQKFQQQVNFTFQLKHRAGTQNGNAGPCWGHLLPAMGSKLRGGTVAAVPHYRLPHRQTILTARQQWY